MTQNLYYEPKGTVHFLKAEFDDFNAAPRNALSSPGSMIELRLEGSATEFEAKLTGS